MGTTAMTPPTTSDSRGTGAPVRPREETHDRAEGHGSPEAPSHPTRGHPVLSMRWAVPIASVALTTLIVGSVGWVGERSARRTLTDEIIRRLCTQATNVALVSQTAFLSPYPELTLHPYIFNLRQRTPELTMASVCDLSGHILGDADPRQLGRPFRAPKGLGTLPGVAAGSNVIVARSPSLLVVSAAIVHPNGTRLGTVYLGIRHSYIEHAVTRAREPVLALLGLLLVVGVGGSFALTSTLLRPIATLRRGLEQIGTGDLETRLKVDSFTDFGVLSSTINRMTADLRRAQHEAIERERLSHEIKLAQHIQRSLLPREQLAEGGFAVTGVQHPAAEVGGDFYDTFRLPDGRIGFAVADVAGKGLAGCMVTSMVAALLVAMRDSCPSPAQLLTLLDRALSQRLEPGVFVTMFVAYVDPLTGQLVYASAGHHPALLVHPDHQWEWLEASGAPIGADRRRGIGRTLSESHAMLSVGDLVLQTTDGIHESSGGPNHELFGVERVAASVSGLTDRRPQRVVQALCDSVAAWRGQADLEDDETVVVLIRESTPASGSPDAQALELMAEARLKGTALMLPVSPESLVRLEAWLATLPEFGPAHPERSLTARLVLHELCANVIEHGYRGRSGLPITVWWVPGPSASGGVDSGHFLIHDQAESFAAAETRRVDYDDRLVRRRGRGFGIDMVRRATRRLDYHPGTAIGNITVVAMRSTDGTQEAA